MRFSILRETCRNMFEHTDVLSKSMTRDEKWWNIVYMLFIVVFFKDFPKLFCATGSKMVKGVEKCRIFSEYVFHTLIGFILRGKTQARSRGQSASTSYPQLISLNEIKNSIEWNLEDFKRDQKSKKISIEWYSQSPQKPMMNHIILQLLCVPFYRQKKMEKPEIMPFSSLTPALHVIEMSLFVGPSEVPFYRNRVPFYWYLVSR